MAQTVTSQQNSDLDSRLLDFVREKVNTLVKWDLVRFFHNNPHAANTAENIARFAARDPATVERELEQLVDSSILEAAVASNRRIYRLIKDQPTRDLVQAFVNACDDRDFRVRAIQLVVEGLQ
ncbi:MAG: hypothetical protein IT319_02055 [Anaerolineae bacterium]|nr:hypothetical protein [Anaerolineae bacterium]